MTERCQGCRYWSQMVAQSIGLSGMEALCLNEKSPEAMKFVKAGFGCPAWAENIYGAWDEPPDYGETVRARYEADKL